MPFLHCLSLRPVLFGTIAYVAASEVHVVAQQLAQSSGAKPVTKVIELLENLESEVKAEGAAEAAAYDSFACFCKDTTLEKSNKIVEAKAKIDTLSASIAEKTAQQKVDTQELSERQVKQEGLNVDLDSTKKELDKEQAAFMAAAADIAKAVVSLRGAVDSLTAAKPSAAVLLSVKETVSRSMALARSMNMTIGQGQKYGFLQAREAVDPSDPEYKYHSQGILDTLTQLLQEFIGKQQAIHSDWDKDKKNFDTKIQDLEEQIETNAERITGLDTSLEELKGGIADDRKTLVLQEAETKDDKLYLRDLTKRCETSANEWDQRSQMRGDELHALGKALQILGDRVKSADEEVNERALLQKRAANASAVPAVERSNSTAKAKTTRKALSLLQVASVGSHDHVLAATQERQQRAQRLLVEESRRLGSPVLASVLINVGKDPFAKVKQLIQELIERLLDEENAEAKKEFFCREELGKAEKERAYRFKDVKKLWVDIEVLEAKEDELREEILVLKGDLVTLKENLNTTMELRETEHENNVATIAKAKEGLEAVTEAIIVLKTFYKQAAKAASFVQASPVDEDTDGPGFSGSYQGRQASSKGVIGMLEVIKTDFERTVSKTTTFEKESLESFVEFERVSKTDIKSKTTKQELDEEDFATTSAKTDTAFDDLKTQMGLVDSAVKQLEALKPTCTDFGMSYEDRVAKRNQEIEALKQALCILVPEGGSEEGC